MSVVQPGDEAGRAPGPQPASAGSDGAEPEEPAGEQRSSPTVLRMVVGHRLRRLREAAGISPDTAGYEIRGSRSKISRIEHGRVSFKERDVADLLTMYGVTDAVERDRVLTLARQASMPGWWTKYGDVLPDWFESYIGLEEAASLIRTYELQFIPGLFQTAEYARAVTLLGHRSATAEEVERRVNLRLKRQLVLSDAGEGPRIWAVIDEAALRRPVGGRAVMRAQLAHLVEVAALPRVTLQVMPFRHGGHAAAGGSFTILRFADPDIPDVVYIEQLTSALYLERREEVDRYMEVMNQLSAEADTPSASVEMLRALSEAI